MRWNRYFALIAAWLCAAACLAAESTVRPTAPQPAAAPENRRVEWRTLDTARYPDANTILLDDRERVHYNCDGTYTRTDESWTLLKTEKGRDGQRTLTLYFNEFYQRPPQVEIELLKADGRVVRPEVQRKIVTEPGQMASNIYDPANKILEIGIPGLEVGDILHVSYQETAIRARMEGIWCDVAVLQTTDPILHYEYEVSAPEDCPLESITVKDEVPGTLVRSMEKRGDRILYRWVAKDVPQIQPEPDMPPVYLCAMRILLSTAPDWQTVSRWYWNLCLPRLEKTSPALIAESRRLAAGKSEAEAIRAIFDFVSKDIRYTGITAEDNAPGYEPHDVAQTFEQRFGVCRDKAALLVAMLRSAGFQAYPVLFMAGNPKDAETPNNYFNHAVAGVTTGDGKLVLMDPTDENTADLLPAYAMDKSFLAAKPDGDTLRRTPEISAERNMLKIRSSASLDRGYKLAVRSNIEFGGINDNIYRSAFARWPREYLEQFAAATLKRAVPGAELQKLRLSPADVRNLGEPLRLELEFTAADYVDIQWGDGVLRMPFLSGGFGALKFLLGGVGLETRRYPLLLSSTASVDEVCTLDLPDSLAAVGMPDYPELSHGPLLMRTDVTAEARQLTGRRRLKLTTSTIVPDAYAALKAALKLQSAADRRRVVVRRSFANRDAGKLFPDAQSVVERFRAEIRIAGPSDYTVDYHERRRILNYGGVKEHSEWSATYYPAFGRTEFTAGSVTGPDGAVQKIDPAAVTVMDAPGAAAAPRYPQAKRLVAPLPGVKPGALIDCRWRETVQGGPALNVWFALTEHAPVVAKELVFSYPEKLEKTLNLAVPVAGFEVSRSAADGRVTLKLTARDLPERPIEPGTPPDWCFAPSVGISFWDCGNYVESVRSAFEKAAAQSALAAETARKLTGKMADPKEKIRVLRDFMALHVRAAGPGLNALGPGFLSAADVTLHDRYGNSADRAVLLYAMLKAAGISQVTPVLASGLPALPRITEKFNELPLNIFDAVLLRVTSGEEEFYLNDTDNYAVLGACAHDNALGVELESGELVTIVSAADCEDAARSDFEIICRPDGTARLVLSESFYGAAYAAANRLFARQTPEERRRYCANAAAALAQDAKQVTFETDFSGYPGIVRQEVEIPNFWLRSGDFVYLTLPDGGAGGLLRTAGVRTLPYYHPGAIDREFHYAVDLPETWGACELAAGDFRWTCPGGEGVVSQEARLTDKTLEVRRAVKLPPFYLSGVEYPVLAEAQRLLSTPGTRTILLKVTGK